MRVCISQYITIENEYPNSSYLFRCLGSPKGDPISPIIATATLITPSTKLEDISRLFRNISTALKDVNAIKAAELLMPLRDKSIFPITNARGNREYDDLLDLHNTSWFIADKPLIRDSFHGKIPLLALPIEDLSILEDLFRVLRLDDRMLSKLTTSQTQPKGRVTTHWDYTTSLRKKSPFIKALIPQSHQDKIAIARQIDEVQVKVAKEVSQTFILMLKGSEVHGNPVRGQLSLSHTGHLLNLLMTEDCAEANGPPHDLVTLIADLCQIKDTNHYSLLCTALNSSSIESISSAFTQQGLCVKGLVLEKSKDKYQARRGELMRMPSPFWGAMNYLGGSSYGLSDSMRFKPSIGGGSLHGRAVDRRLPIMNLVKVDGLVIQNSQAHNSKYEDGQIDGWDYVQYLGEHMMSKVLQTNLGQSYDPERDWTSKLRNRSGLRPFKDPTPCAAFTMRSPKILDQMTTLIIKYGISQTPNWQQRLRECLPIYHLELAVSAGSKTSSFVITTSQVERMRQFRMHTDANKSNTDVVILVRVSDVYSEDQLSIEFLVDPWRLFETDILIFQQNWIAKGLIQDNSSSSTKKRRKIHEPSVTWAMQETPGMHRSSITSLRACMDRERYSHRPLEPGNIRLLYLLPGEGVDHLQGVIIHVPYKSAEIYRALSYVWGTDSRREDLISPDGTLSITFSLSKALRALRHKNTPIMLWVDAICINQKDNKEKAKQIRLLPEIFQTAASTYAFLDGSDESNAAIEMLMQVRAKAAYDEELKLEADSRAGAELEDRNHSNLETNSRKRKRTDLEEGPNSTYDPCSKDWPNMLPRLPESWKGRSVPHLDDSIWHSVRDLFDLSWFRRVWIIQEIVGAQHVKIVCGKWVMDWNDLYLAMEIVDREIQLSDNDYSYLKSSWEPFLSLAAQREWEARQYRWSLMMLLENFRYAESTLSRDRLFALLGLASDGNEADFEPDYESPLEVILLRFARVFVRQERGMQMLYRAGISSRSDKFPSWIPDWTVKRPSNLYDTSENDISFSASGPQQAKIECIPDTDELLVEGYEVDIITGISTSSNIQMEWEKYFKEIDATIDSAVLSPVRESREDLKWKVPIAGVLYPKVPVSRGLDLKTSYIALRRHINSNCKGKAREESSSSTMSNISFQTYPTALDQPVNSFEKQSASYIAALQDTLRGWRFIVTKRGFLGVVPNLSQIGDVVAILKGGRVPFILQKSEKRPGGFRLVGESYVHGMMNGEGMLLPGVEERKFKIH